MAASQTVLVWNRTQGVAPCMARKVSGRGNAEDRNTTSDMPHSKKGSCVIRLHSVKWTRTEPQAANRRVMVQRG